MTTENPIHRSVVLQSNPQEITRLCKSLLNELKTNNFSEEVVFSVHLALQEAFTNAVVHGNEFELSKKVKIEYLVKRDKVEIYVTDEGVGFDPSCVPDPRYGENLYKTNGRGLFLMRSYMDVIEFNETGNRVYMVKYKKKSSLKNKQTRQES
ncbi:MAG TPA: ATP-binding protein [Anaerolineae bacterium]|nr:ATP-binding protein [Anaerolineae bacterium]